MRAGFANLVVRPTSTSRCLFRRAAQVAHVHTPSQAPPSPEAIDPMFAKANKAFEANPPPARNTLAKQLFPSSSPSAPAGDIRDQFKKPGSTNYAAVTSLARTPSSSTFSKPSSNRTTNSTSSTNNGNATKGSLASLFNKQDSFKHESGVIDLTAPDAQAKIKEAVYFAEDDFSDDDDLDLDYEAPSALPLPPPKPAAAKENIPPPPPPRSLKFESPGPHRLRHTTLLPSPSSQLNAPAQKKIKKRVLPASFRSEESTKEEKGAIDLTSTPPAKAKNIWDASASAIKEQKKQLKSQRQAQTDSPEEEVVTEFGKSRDTSKNDAISLSSEQEHVLDLVVNQNKSVFFTGPAGTGKSVLMRAIINKLRAKYSREPDRIAVTASTGLAACNIGGITLHSFSGIGLGKEDASALVKKIRRNQKAKNRWLRTKCLIIDEISMVDGDLFDKLSQIGRTIRNNGRPWGGIQLILTGDFFQLPPVPDGAQKRDVKFAFESATWGTSIDHTIGLTQVFRQRDPEFARMLNEMRLGQISQATVEAFRALARPLQFDDGVESAELFPTRAQVDGSNERKLRELPGKSYRFDSLDTGDQVIRDKLLSNMMAPKSLELKVNSQVMLIKNLDESLVNGTLGKVVAFSDEKTFDMNSPDSFDSDMPDAMAKARKKLGAFGHDGDSSSSVQKFPVVQFIATDGVSRVILCQPEEWKVELPNGEVQAKRTQLPLILAWALSIHKAQGQTLERVTVNLGKVFEKGQAYVALSRATSQQGLRVLGFDKTKVMAHPRVITFYRQLYSAEEALARKPNKVSDFVSNRKGVAPAKKPSQVIDLDDDEAAMASFGY
ncbi:ATP-dependent DNA helicase PIF1 [Cladobotryum mycophilum]|uniref:ATP-dependent DNA helicase PIF1 n=1 Tax=Cladobotryum mycophilum TaxID=491253 RepID=A0ABR0SAG8_9HYPO